MYGMKTPRSTWQVDLPSRLAKSNGGAMESAKERIKDIIRILRREYPKARTALRHGSAFELLVSTILSAQCTDERVNKIAPGLFKRYKGPQNFARAKQSVLETEILRLWLLRLIP